jgi:hypothetical protein
MEYTGEAKWAWLAWFTAVLIVGGLIVAGVAIKQAFDEQRECTELGRVYYKGLCFHPDTL